MKLILYSKPGCHLCEGLQEKLEQIHAVELEIRDITTREDWFQAYQYEIPVLLGVRSQESGVKREELEGKSSQTPENASLIPIPRPSPRATVQQLEQMLQKYL